MKKLTVLIFVLIVSQNIFAQSGWIQQNPPFVDWGLSAVYFANENTGWAAGGGGIVKSTTDGGMNWVSQGIAPSRILFSYIAFVNESKGFLISLQGRIYKTTNKGLNWNDINIQDTSPRYQIKFTDQSTGYLCEFGAVMKTTNAGDNWSNVLESPVKRYVSLCFLNNNTGWVSTQENIIYKTTNGGVNWDLIQGSTPYVFVKTIQFVNESTGFIWGTVGNSPGYALLTKTTNGGANWSTVLTDAYSASANMFFLNEQTGYAAGGNFVIYKTDNGGTNWIKTGLYGRNAFGGIYIFSNQRGFAVGERGTIAKTEDGVNWSFLYNGYEAYPLEVAQFLNSSTGWISGDGLIYRTTNSGANWNKYSLYITPYGSTKNISFINENTGWLAGIEGTGNFFIKTYDGGRTWGREPYKGTATSFINSTTGWMSGDTIRKTTDAGNTWLVQSILNTDGISFINELSGWANNSAIKTIYKTTNGGANWSIAATGTAPYHKKIFFANANTGFLGANGYTYKSTNGGSNWFLISNQNSRFQFLNENTGWITGGGQSYYKTTNGGESWIATTFPFNPNMYSMGCVYFYNDLTGWVTFANGVILKTINGGVSVNQISSVIPEKFSLSQNYPNPFNPSTKINYELKITNYVSLKVFDLLGKEVASLVNEKQSAGSYAVDFNSAEYNLPSGIYFYTLNAGDFKETKKMVLVK